MLEILSRQVLAVSRNADLSTSLGKPVFDHLTVKKCFLCLNGDFLDFNLCPLSPVSNWGPLLHLIYPFLQVFIHMDQITLSFHFSRLNSPTSLYSRVRCSIPYSLCSLSFSLLHYVPVPPTVGSLVLNISPQVEGKNNHPLSTGGIVPNAFNLLYPFIIVGFGGGWVWGVFGCKGCTSKMLPCSVCQLKLILWKYLNIWILFYLLV